MLAAQYQLPPTPKQVDYARAIAARLKLVIPPDQASDRRSLSEWIDRHKAKSTARAPGATSRQVAFAERIARAKRRAIPDECFRDAGMMSRWIDANR
ncbi:hypothetical protein [Aliiroseovarius subalbicans]|uniref:hypothetical protein n=1 Tax=Aliiroseovarius subalbicans TaxID=2925840 RepID=UPI001F57D581|nr:hypothetical protein [Aliiroseovarius subalbicans]MCI2397823.1 hypothetical protein [Aliiroseovarius subalbicans]